MPARTFSVPMDADRSLRQSRHQIHPPSLHLGPLRDPHDDRLQSNHVPYDMTVPPPFMHLSHNSFPIFDQLYPSSPIPPLLQIHHQHTHPQIRSGATFISFPSVAGALPLQPTPYQAMTSPPPWHPSQHPYYHIPPPLPPPPIPHKVWILDCKSCGMFLTNRGMKAVLLLRPNVPLYSTDAMPINCSAYTYTSDPPPSASGVLPSSGGTSLGRSYTTHQDRSRAVARTCECLTQTLCCHGCGGGVGYMIVSPCQRCTSSITATNRTTNGHRFVFYSSEITACERHYVAGESGVIPHVPPIPPMPGFPPPHPPTGVQYIAAQGTSSPTFDYIPVSSPESERSLSPSASNNPSGHSTPELTAGFTAISLSPRRDHQHYVPGSRSINDSLRSTHRQHHQTPPSPPAPPPSYAASPRNWESPHLAPYIPDARITPITIPAESPYEPLKPGDVLYWNHLVRSGEIPGVMEDPRARGSSSTTPLDSKRSSIDSRATSPLSASTRNASSKVRRLAGR